MKLKEIKVPVEETT